MSKKRVPIVWVAVSESGHEIGFLVALEAKKGWQVLFRNAPQCNVSSHFLSDFGIKKGTSRGVKAL